MKSQNFNWSYFIVAPRNWKVFIQPHPVSTTLNFLFMFIRSKFFCPSSEVCSLQSQLFPAFSRPLRLPEGQIFQFWFSNRNNKKRPPPSLYLCLFLRYSLIFLIFKIKNFPCVVLHFVALILVMLMNYVVKLFCHLMKCSLSKDSEIDKIKEAQGKMLILVSKLRRTDFNAIVKYVFSLGQPTTFLQSRKVKRLRFFKIIKNIKYIIVF